MQRKPILFCLIVLMMMIFSTVAAAQVAAEKKATINELTATSSETHLIVFGTLENSFTSEMIDLLHSGIPLRFSFYVELYKTTESWREKLIIANNFQHILTFDTLKDTYKVTLEEDNNKVLSFRSLFEAQKQINEINGVKVVELKQLLPDNRYKLKMKAELYRKTLPLSLHNILPFLSWWDIETDWHTLTFTL